MLAFIENLDASIKIALNRIGLNVGKDRVFDACCIKDVECGSDHWQLCKSRIGDEERAFDACRFQHGGQFPDAARSEKHGGREIPFGSQSGHVDCFPDIKAFPAKVRNGFA